MDEQEITVRLTIPEFVVLDELLRRYSATGQLVVVDQAEQRALWNLQCIFERDSPCTDTLPTVEQARNELRDSTD